MRYLTGHQVNDANKELIVQALDEAGCGGASHLYQIEGFDSASNPSDPWTKRHGRPAKHSTVLFQNGPIKEAGVNGVTHEALLAIIIDRLEGFQKGPAANLAAAELATIEAKVLEFFGAAVRAALGVGA